MELKRFLRKDDERRKRSLVIKVTTSLDDEKDELESLEDLEKDEHLAFYPRNTRRFWY